MTLLLITICAIGLHHQIESFLGIGKNSVLLIAPLICSGVVMILKKDRARYYVEREVDWWTLLFFMLLFAIAGTLEHTHVDLIMANYFSSICGTDLNILVPFIIALTSIGSAFVDNVIFVAAFCPVIEQLSYTVKDLPLWWALLFGACFGGNITMIGSTANIVALGMLEKRSRSRITFFQWFRIGAVASFVAAVIAWLLLILAAPLMPDRPSFVKPEMLGGIRFFENKHSVIEGYVKKAPSPEYVIKEKNITEKDFNHYILHTDSSYVPIMLYVPKNSPMNKDIVSKDRKDLLYYRGRLYSYLTSHGGKLEALVLEEISQKKPEK